MTTSFQKVRNNFAEKASAVARSLPSMTVRDAGSFVAVDCGFPSDTFNVIVACDLSAPEHLLAEGVSPFTAKRWPVALWYWEDAADRHNMAALTAYGLTHTETHVAMFADLSRVHSSVPTPEGLLIKPVTQAEETRGYGAVIAELFGSDEGRQVAAYYRLLSAYPVGRLPALRAYIGSYGGEIVATGTLFTGKDTVGIYDIVTRADLRRRGVGTAMFARLLKDAQDYGRHAVLQASPDGLGIYARAGFESVGTVHTFENRALLEDNKL